MKLQLIELKMLNQKYYFESQKSQKYIKTKKYYFKLAYPIDHCQNIKKNIKMK